MSLWSSPRRSGTGWCRWSRARLGEVTPLPAALKQVAGFAPARRARLGATAIMSELERDEELRERVAVQVRARATDDAVDVAALAWLERTEELDRRRRRVAERPRVERRRRRAGPARAAAPGARRRGRARAARAAPRHKEALDALKAEVATLRRTLGETRTKERAAREEAEGPAPRAEERPPGSTASCASSAPRSRGWRSRPAQQRA